MGEFENDEVGDVSGGLRSGFVYGFGIAGGEGGTVIRKDWYDVRLVVGVLRKRFRVFDSVTRSAGNEIWGGCDSVPWRDLCATRLSGHRGRHCGHGPVAKRLWIPALAGISLRTAGMAVVVHKSRGGRELRHIPRRAA